MCAQFYLSRSRAKEGVLALILFLAQDLVSPVCIILVRFTWWCCDICPLEPWEITDQGNSVLITISVYVVIDTTNIKNQSLTFVQKRAWHEWRLWSELDPYCGQRWGLSTSQGLMLLETHFQGSKIECLELYCYYTANNWCQQSAASSTGNQKILLFSLSIHDPISYLSISCCRVKEASFSVAAAQSVSVSGVEDQPAHQILSSMLKLKISF